MNDMHVTDFKQRNSATHRLARREIWSQFGFGLFDEVQPSGAARSKERHRCGFWGTLAECKSSFFLGTFLPGLESVQQLGTLFHDSEIGCSIDI
jgi:hypothetical protein